MAEGLNEVRLIGNLGADPELRYTKGGQAVLNLRIAVTEKYLDKNKERKERTDWITCSLWGARAEALSKYLHNGSRLHVSGALRVNSYEKDGQKRYSTEVAISNVILLDGRNGAEQNAGARSQKPATEQEPADFPADSDIPF